MFEKSTGSRRGRPRQAEYADYLRVALDIMSKQGRFPRRDDLLRELGGGAEVVSGYMPRLAANIAFLAEQGAEVQRMLQEQRRALSSPVRSQGQAQEAPSPEQVLSHGQHAMTGSAALSVQ